MKYKMVVARAKKKGFIICAESYDDGSMDTEKMAKERIATEIRQDTGWSMRQIEIVNGTLTIKD